MTNSLGAYITSYHNSESSCYVTTIDQITAGKIKTDRVTCSFSDGLTASKTAAGSHLGELDHLARGRAAAQAALEGKSGVALRER